MEVRGMNRALTPLFGKVATSDCFNKATVVHVRKKMWVKKGKNIRLRSREKNHPPLMLQNSFFTVSVLILQKISPGWRSPKG